MSTILDALRHATHHTRVPVRTRTQSIEAVSAAIASRPRRRRPDPNRFLAFTTLTLVMVTAVQAAAWVMALTAIQLPDVPSSGPRAAPALSPSIDGGTVMRDSASGVQDLRADNDRGVILLQNGDAIGAVTAFRSLLRVRPDNVAGLVNLSIASQAAGNTAEARAALIRAERLAPRNAAVRYNLAVFYDRDGNVPKALEHYRAFLEVASAADAARMAAVRRRLTELDAHTR